MNYTPRKWQKASFDVVSRCNTSSNKEVIPVNACVGSGKTAVASYALGDFILNHRTEKTFQMFVTPRIKLCSQQANSICNDIHEMTGLEAGKDFEVMRRDCSIDDGIKFNPKKNQYAKHIILVICDESLWGKDDKANDPDVRFHSYMSGFEKMVENGYVFGNAVFDEAHNFTGKHDKIFGETV